MRLIDADKIDFNEVFVGASEFAQDTRKAAQMLIDKQPTINNWIKVEYHYVTDEEREKDHISDDIAYMFDCRLPDDEEEILIVRKINGKYCTEHDICLIDDVYCLDSGTDWIDVVAWMPMPTYCELKI